MICLCDASTGLEQLCAHPQEDNCINTSVLVAVRYAGQDGVPSFNANLTLFLSLSNCASVCEKKTLIILQ